MAPIDWAAVSAQLPAGKDAESKAKRSEMFKSMDPNGNGYLSLAEVDKGVRDVIQLDGVFQAKPVIMRAFTAAKNFGKDTGVGADYIQRKEFRLLLQYLRDYFELYAMFDNIDSSDDGRVDFDEFSTATSQLGKWGVTVSDPQADFAELNSDGGDKVLFKEFAEWAIKKHLDLDDDDDE